MEVNCQIIQVQDKEEEAMDDIEAIECFKCSGSGLGKKGHPCKRCGGTGKI